MSTKKAFRSPRGRSRRALRNRSISIAFGATPSSRSELEALIEQIERRVLEAPVENEEDLLDEYQQVFLHAGGQDDGPVLDVPSLIESAVAAADTDVGQSSIICKLCGSAVESIHDHMRDDHKFLHPELYKIMFSLSEDYPMACIDRLHEYFIREEDVIRIKHHSLNEVSPDLYFEGDSSMSLIDVIQINDRKIKYHLSIGRTITDIAEEVCSIQGGKSEPRTAVTAISKRYPARKIKKRSILGYPASDPALAPSPAHPSRRGSAFPRENA